jgi:hypothetical protein
VRDPFDVADRFAELDAVFDRVAFVRVWPGHAYPRPPRKRRDGRPIVVIGDAEALGGLRAALGATVEYGEASLMTWPNLAFELVDGGAETLAVVGYIHGGWLRMDGAFDRQLIDHYGVVAWLEAWAPQAFPTGFVDQAARGA